MHMYVSCMCMYVRMYGNISHGNVHARHMCLSVDTIYYLTHACIYGIAKTVYMRTYVRTIRTRTYVHTYMYVSVVVTGRK